MSSPEPATPAPLTPTSAAVVANHDELTDPWPRKALMVCSTGGHLAQMLRLEPWYRHRDVHWVTFDKPDGRSLLAGQEITWAHHPTTRNIPNLLRNLWLALKVMRRERPDVIVTSGAGVAVPFFFLAKIFGAKTVFIEVYDRLDSVTMSGRLCRPFTDSFLVQWDEQADLYPDTTVIGRLL